MEVDNATLNEENADEDEEEKMIHYAFTTYNHNLHGLAINRSCDLEARVIIEIDITILIS